MSSLGLSIAVSIKCIIQAGCHRRQLNLGYNLSRFIFCCCIFVFDDLYFVDLVGSGLVFFFNVKLGLLYSYLFSAGFNFDFFSTSNWLERESLI